MPYALTFLFGGWTYFSIENILQYENLQNTFLFLKSRTLEAQRLEKEFLLRYTYDENFFKTGNNQFLDENFAIIDELLFLTDSLKQFGLASEEKIDAIRLVYGAYQSQLDSLATTMKKKGHESYGLIGDLRRSIHFVEKSALDYDRYYMLNLRRYEKDFLIRNDLKYLKNFNEEAMKLEDHIRIIGASNPRLRDEILAEIRSYKDIFHRVADLQEKIGFTEKEGFRGQLVQSGVLLSREVDELTEEANTLAKAKVQQNYLGLLLLFILIVVAGVFILVFHVKRITRNINLIKSTAATLALGKFPESAKVNSVDELGQAHQALNTLTEGLRGKTQFAREVGEGELSADFKSLGEDDILGNSLIKMRDNLRGAISDVQSVIEQAGEEGNLSAKIDLEGRKGAWKEMAESVNILLESIMTPITALKEVTEAMSEGNLSRRYTAVAKGDVKVLSDGLNKAQKGLNTLLYHIIDQVMFLNRSSLELSTTSDEMNRNTGEIATAIVQMKDGATKQVVQVGEARERIDEILSSSDKMGNRSERITEAARTGVSHSQKGVEVLEEVISKIENISDLSEDTNQAMRILMDRSEEISRVLNVITDIAAQTNLLALNAAIEAAQAGEAGRGFAVVAEEIRKLAEDSKQSAQEIEKVIDLMHRDTRQTAHSVDQMNDSIKSGKESTNIAYEVFKEIAQSSEETLILSDEILRDSNDQRALVSEVVSLSESVVVIAEQTASGSEQMAGSSSELSTGMQNFSSRFKELSQIANSLDEEVKKFSLKSDVEIEEVPMELPDTTNDFMLN